MRKNTDHNNSEYGHFLRSERDTIVEIAIKGQYPLRWRKRCFIKKKKESLGRFMGVKGESGAIPGQNWEVPFHSHPENYGIESFIKTKTIIKVHYAK